MSIFLRVLNGYVNMPLHNMLHRAGSLHRQCLQHVRIVGGISCHVPEAHLCHVILEQFEKINSSRAFPSNPANNSRDPQLIW
ncbi:unnamed protein product [Musa hybrid cultivar]